GRFDYYVGGLQTRNEAESAVEIMKKKGFRDPQIIEWCDGVKTNLSNASAGERVSYRISITNGGLDDVVREVISTMADGCQVSRLGENNFLVSSCASRAAAERVAQAISKCNDALVVEVQEVKPEGEKEEEE
ncbi:MAG: SPOR domain-containing protein, partial [Alistipes sp.]|nr:SPOR domain-containing protein [Alistipes sp.]